MIAKEEKVVKHFGNTGSLGKKIPRHNQENISKEIAISTITSNPADILRLKGKGKVEEGYDADLCILDQELQLVEVIAKGNTVYTK